MPPYTILKVSKQSAKDVEVLGEFETQDEARASAERYQMSDESNAYDYCVECPPERRDPVDTILS